MIAILALLISNAALSGVIYWLMRRLEARDLELSEVRDAQIRQAGGVAAIRRPLPKGTTESWFDRKAQ